MAYTFRRLFRTPYSEVYDVLDDEQSVGRLDVHVDQTLLTADCNLCVGESLTEEEARDLMDEAEQEILGGGFMPDEINFSVHQGKTIVSETLYTGDEDDDEDDED